MIPSDITTATLLAIQNTISRYCLALDTRDFSILKQVFTEDMHADYSAVSPTNRDVRGLDALIDNLMVILEGKITQHALSTQILDFVPTNGTATDYECRAVTYFTANTFVDKNRTKEILDHVTVYGRYEDQLVETSLGEWRIRERKVVTFCADCDYCSTNGFEIQPHYLEQACDLWRLRRSELLLTFKSRLEMKRSPIHDIDQSKQFGRLVCQKADETKVRRQCCCQR